ncbi:MAG TPA: hypothetical protein DCY51_06725 [Bacteroidetes bacterium]|nr:hypothetical protein [Bacteroidota bacterium]
MAGNKYKEKVSDDSLINLIETGIQNSTGEWLNSSDMTRERQRSTYEFAGIAADHLAPQGVSSIVDTSTTETVEAYTSILSDLFLNNGKLARFVPYDNSPGSFKSARDASMITNYAIFKQNNGWELIQTWIKSALLWKNGIIRWDYVEGYDYEFEEYEKISQGQLDILLAEEGVEIIGNLNYENELGELNMETGQQDAELVYVDVRIRRKNDNSRVKIENIPPESFRISRDAKSIDDASFVGIQTILTRSEIRKMWPDVADNIGEDEWDELGDDTTWDGNGSYAEDIAARKLVTGQSYLQGRMADDITALEANREVTITECWINVDRDGDGVAELKHFIIAGDTVLYEKDIDMIPIACLSPIDIPYEFYGLSIADFTRSSTLASTAILRGFVENTYLTNYSPKLADPNVVDFSALQNMRPKQIIPTNGNPNGAVSSLPPEAISSGTVPLLSHLQTIKEQATGMSKAAQGLNDSLYVSGNSESKVAAVKSASQKRIQHIARRFAETGMKRLCTGVYKTMRKCLKTHSKFSYQGVFAEIDIMSLPSRMDVEVFLDIGENSNSNMIKKFEMVGSQILPALNSQGQGVVIRPEAPAILATKLIESMGIDSNDYLEDYTTDEFKQKAMETVKQQTEKAQKDGALLQRKAEADASLAEANVTFTNAQSKNTVDDNTKQLAISIDKHFQEWAEIDIKARKEGIEPPMRPDFNQITTLARAMIAGEA